MSSAVAFATEQNLGLLVAVLGAGMALRCRKRFVPPAELEAPSNVFDRSFAIFAAMLDVIV